MARTQTDLMRRVFGAIVGADPRYFGASLWFAVTG
jgi:hypothetical protein